MLHDARARAVQDMPDVDVSLGLSEETFEPTLKKYPVGGRPAPCKPYAWAGLRIAGGVCPGGAEPLTWSVRRSRPDSEASGLGLKAGPAAARKPRAAAARPWQAR